MKNESLRDKIYSLECASINIEDWKKLSRRIEKLEIKIEYLEHFKDKHKGKVLSVGELQSISIEESRKWQSSDCFRDYNFILVLAKAIHDAQKKRMEG